MSFVSKIYAAGITTALAFNPCLATDSKNDSLEVTRRNMGYLGQLPDEVLIRIFQDPELAHRMHGVCRWIEKILCDPAVPYSLKIKWTEDNLKSFDDHLKNNLYLKKQFLIEGGKGELEPGIQQAEYLIPHECEYLQKYLQEVREKLFIFLGKNHYENIGMPCFDERKTDTRLLINDFEVRISKQAFFATLDYKPYLEKLGINTLTFMDLETGRGLNDWEETKIIDSLPFFSKLEDLGIGKWRNLTGLFANPSFHILRLDASQWDGSYPNAFKILASKWAQFPKVLSPYSNLKAAHKDQYKPFSLTLKNATPDFMRALDAFKKQPYPLHLVIEGSEGDFLGALSTNTTVRQLSLWNIKAPSLEGLPNKLPNLISISMRECSELDLEVLEKIFKTGLPSLIDITIPYKYLTQLCPKQSEICAVREQKQWTSFALRS